MKNLILMSALLLSSACSSHDDPTPKPVKIRPVVELVAVTVTGLAPSPTRPNLSIQVGTFTSATLASATIPARFWIPGSYKGNQVFRVVVLNNGQPMSSVEVDPELYSGNHKFNVGSGNTDLTIELAF